MLPGQKHFEVAKPQSLEFSCKGNRQVIIILLKCNPCFRSSSCVPVISFISKKSFALPRTRRVELNSSRDFLSFVKYSVVLTRTVHPLDPFKHEQCHCSQRYHFVLLEMLILFPDNNCYNVTLGFKLAMSFFGGCCVPFLKN